MISDEAAVIDNLRKALEVQGAVKVQRKGGAGENGVIQSDISEEGLRPLLEEYVRHLPAQVVALGAELARQDMRALSERVHNLRGSGGLFGLMPITNAAVRAERFIEENHSLEAIQQEVEGLISIIKRVEGFDAAAGAGHRLTAK